MCGTPIEHRSPPFRLHSARIEATIGPTPSSNVESQFSDLFRGLRLNNVGGHFPLCRRKLGAHLSFSASRASSSDLRWSASARRDALPASLPILSQALSSAVICCAARSAAALSPASL